jgi:hypothetical protein
MMRWESQTTHHLCVEPGFVLRTLPQVKLPKSTLRSYEVIGQSQIVQRLVPLCFERVLLPLNDAQLVQLFASLLGQRLHLS